MNKETQKARSCSGIYSCHPKVSWVVEQQGLQLIHHELETCLTLHYPEAAVWDLASQGYNFWSVTDLMTKIASITPDDANQIVSNCMDDLTRKGFLQKTA